MRSSQLDRNVINRFKSRTFNDSTVWTADFSGTVMLYVCGGGGSGAMYEYTNAAHASGGGAGGMAIKRVKVESGTAYTITIGAGGTKLTSQGHGVAGGNTSFVGGSINMVGNGGAGGTYSHLLGTGGAGGTASGGDWNNTGGRGGNSVKVNSSEACGTGGGAVGLYGDGYRGGDNSYTGSVGTGGAGIGGNGGDATSTVSRGGGTGGAGGTASLTEGADSGGWWHNSLIDISAKGGNPISAAVVFDQTVAGGNGNINQTITGLVAGPLCGGGGLGSYSTTNQYATSGYYGGGGGGAAKDNATGATSSGAGGDGFVFMVMENTYA